MDATRDLRCDPILVQQKSFSIDALEGGNYAFQTTAATTASP
jgi:hypothetical protein